MQDMYDWCKKLMGGLLQTGEFVVDIPEYYIFNFRIDELTVWTTAVQPTSEWQHVKRKYNGTKSKTDVDIVSGDE